MLHEPLSRLPLLVTVSYDRICVNTSLHKLDDFEAFVRVRCRPRCLWALIYKFCRTNAVVQSCKRWIIHIHTRHILVERSYTNKSKLQLFVYGRTNHGGMSSLSYQLTVKLYLLLCKPADDIDTVAEKSFSLSQIWLLESVLFIRSFRARCLQTQICVDPERFDLSETFVLCTRRIQFDILMLL